MYQSIILSVLFATSLSYASTKASDENKEINKIYADFTKQKNELLKSDLDKKNIKSKFEETYKNLEKSLAEVKAIESTSKTVMLSSEGNEMAYDLEVLEPLKNLATGILTKEECVKAQHEHDLNFPIIEDEQAQSIKNILNKVCSN